MYLVPEVQAVHGTHTVPSTTCSGYRRSVSYLNKNSICWEQQEKHLNLNTFRIRTVRTYVEHLVYRYSSTTVLYQLVVYCIRLLCTRGGDCDDYYFCAIVTDA